MKSRSFLFTATSGDDEIIDYDHMMKSFNPKNTKKFITIGKNKVNIFNNGNSVNFIHGGVVGPFIKMVQAELVLSVSKLSYGKRSKIETLDIEDKKYIAKKWIDFFEKN